jgi:hypothetical protein
MIAWHKPNMTPEEIQDYLRQNRVTKDVADEDFASYIKRYVKNNDELLQKIGSDFDENGTPYWLKVKKDQIKGRDDV